MNKRENVLSLLDADQTPAYIPAAFFLHFPQACHRGQAAIEKHLEFFRYTGMDFVKIQYELAFPHRPEIQAPADWARMPSYGREFFQPQLDVVKGLVQAAKQEALVVLTLYSPFMCAVHTASDQTVSAHLKSEPEKFKLGMEIITDSLLWFVRACIELGIDGFYASTQGGESHRFDDPALFSDYVKPYDLIVMEEIDRACTFNILHICDYCGPYSDLAPFLDYPGHVVNSPLVVGNQELTGRQVAEMFGRPYMGGMDRHGVIVGGSPREIQAAVETVIDRAPERFILGADCTLPSDIDWANVKTAIDAAHAYRQ